MDQITGNLNVSTACSWQKEKNRRYILVTYCHYNDVIMGVIASQITCLTIVYSIVYSDADQRKHHSSASLAFVRGFPRVPVNSPHTWPVTRKMFPFDDVITWKEDTSDRWTSLPQGHWYRKLFHVKHVCHVAWLVSSGGDAFPFINSPDTDKFNSEKYQLYHLKNFYIWQVLPLQSYSVTCDLWIRRIH